MRTAVGTARRSRAAVGNRQSAVGDEAGMADHAAGLAWVVQQGYAPTVGEIACLAAHGYGADGRPMAAARQEERVDG